MQGQESDKIRLIHILDSIQEIEQYIIEKDVNDFANNSMLKFAAIKQIEIIGEAISRISDNTKIKFPEIEWKKIS
jgi:uncharacterized protein with HEPN domain